jgi:peptide/nickel transport system substrate-binding protein
MKKIVVLITLASGASLILALLWVLGAQNSTVVAAPDAKQASGAGYTLGTNELRADDPVEPTPHPILSDVSIRRAIAYCTDKDALIASVYPTLTLAQRQELVMDSFIPKTSWAYTAPSTTYPYSPTLGQSLLEDAGWILPAGADYRLKNGKELLLQLNTTDAELRQTYLSVFETQMKTCGIHVVRNHQSSTWLFSETTGLFVRDFELGAFAWVAEDDPGGVDLYGCDQIPSPINGWTGQNIMGWCNQAASDAIVQASDTSLPQDQRKASYATFIDLLSEDMPSLPLFLREGGPVWEHIDFNLETFAQDEAITPAGTGSTGLTFTDYQGNQHTVTAPVGAVTETVTLRYYPLVSNANPPPDYMVAANAFRLNVILGGVPQDTFSFSEPVTVTVKYNLEDSVYHINETTLALYLWDSDSSAWVDASETCPMADRYKRLDTTQNQFEVHICHLSEFGLFVKGGKSIRMGVNYGLNETAGMYEVGHTFWITVTDSVGILKANAVTTTAVEGTGPDFAWSDGFWVKQEDWSVPTIDIQPGDQVYFQSDDGFTETLQVGTITAQLYPSNNTAAGTITAPGFDEPLQGFAGFWGLTWQEFTVDPDGGSYLVDFSPYDLVPGNTISVGYREPDLDSVSNAFDTPLNEIDLPIVQYNFAP